MGAPLPLLPGSALTQLHMVDAKDQQSSPTNLLNELLPAPPEPKVERTSLVGITVHDADHLPETDRCPTIRPQPESKTVATCRFFKTRNYMLAVCDFTLGKCA